MRFCLLVPVLTLLIAAVAHAAPYGPLVAGTAPGPVSIASPTYVLGVHYPFGPGCGAMDYGNLTGSHPEPFNGTYPYDEWPDKARVAGKYPVMSSDIVIFSSTRKK